MFRSRRRALQWDSLHDLHGISSVVEDFGARRRWRRAGYQPRRGRRPSLLLILLAGLAGVALVKLMSAADRPRYSTLEKIVIGVLLLAAAALVLRFRRSARRHAWSI